MKQHRLLSIRALGLDRKYSYSPRRLFWDMKVDVGGQTRYFGGSFIDRLFFGCYSWWLGLRLRVKRSERDNYFLMPFTQGVRSLLVKDCSETFLSLTTPITLHSEGRLMLFYK